jgi:hypothetical protein
VLTLVATISPEVRAQNAGSLRGIVTDPSNSLVPGATVVVASNNVARTAVSDGQGRYTLPNLAPGKYTIRADAPGFVTFLRSETEVSNGQATSFDIALLIAAETQQISVNDQSAAALSTDSSSNISAPGAQ